MLRPGRLAHHPPSFCDTRPLAEEWTYRYLAAAWHWAWEAMHGDMTGYHEIRVTGPGRHQYRLFCLLEAEPPGPDRRPALIVLAGMDKPFRTVFSADDYVAVKALGTEYLARVPRRWG